MPVQYLLQLLVQLVPLGEKIIELNLPQHIPQCGLGQKGRRQLVVFHLNHSLFRFSHPVVNDRIHLDADIVLGDDHLLGHINGEDPQVQQYNPVDDGDDEEYARSLHPGKAAQTEYDHPLVLPDDLNGLVED